MRFNIIYPSNETLRELGSIFTNVSQYFLMMDVFSSFRQSLFLPFIGMSVSEEMEIKIIRVTRADVEQARNIFEGDKELMGEVIEYIKKKAEFLDEESIKAIALASLAATYKVFITESSNR